MNEDIEEEDSEVIVESINDAKSAIRTIQEKLYDDPINPKDIFKLTLKLNEFLDDFAIKIHEKSK